MRSEAHGVPMKFMAWDTWRSALQGLDNMEEDIHLCPHWLGEPTIHPRFDQFVEYAFAINKNNRIFREFKLHTNAVVFSEARARLLIRLANQPGQAVDTFRFIHFSIDAFTPQTYKLVKGADFGVRVNRNVRRFLEIRDEMGARLPRAMLAFVVQPENAHEAAAFQQHWSEILAGLGCNVVQTWDWPAQLEDALYFRRLNCGEQAKSDALHARVVRGLGIAPPGSDVLRGAESF